MEDDNIKYLTWHTGAKPGLLPVKTSISSIASIEAIGARPLNKNT